MGRQNFWPYQDPMMGGWGVALGAFARYGVCGEDGALYAETRIQASFFRKKFPDNQRKTDTGAH